jgi:hypothetical protein
MVSQVHKLEKNSSAVDIILKSLRLNEAKLVSDFLGGTRKVLEGLFSGAKASGGGTFIFQSFFFYLLIIKMSSNNNDFDAN